MKLICSKANLVQGVNIVMKAVPSKTTMAILECILIDATTNEIKLTANDMELGIETKVKGDITERGKIAIDAKFLAEILRKLPDSEVAIETDANFVATISCEKFVFTISGKDGRRVWQRTEVSCAFDAQESRGRYAWRHDCIGRFARRKRGIRSSCGTV